MSSTTVAEFANELKKSTDTLLDQLKSAGVAKSAASDVLTDSDKHSLLNYLQNAHGTASADRKKITLVKKQTTEIKQADATGRARTIQVEVRKKRTFVRRDDDVVPVATPEAVEHEVADTTPAASVIDHAELARREEEARRQAELIRRQEEELAQRRRDREEQEVRTRETAEKQATEAAARKEEESKQVKSAAAVAASAEPAQADAVDAAKVAAAAREKSVAASKALADE